MAGVKGKSGGSRSGTGRPAYFKVSHGQFLIIERSSLTGEFQKPEAGQVVGISNNELELQIGNDILVIRIPEPDELQVSVKAG